MGRVRKVLVATWDGGGNIPPTAALAGAMVARGDEVVVLGHRTTRAAFEHLRVGGCCHCLVLSVRWWRWLVALAGRLDRTGMSHQAGSYEVTITRPVRAGESPRSVDSSYPRQPKRQWVNRVRPNPETHPTHSPTTPLGWWMRATVIIPVGVVGARSVPADGLAGHCCVDRSGARRSVPG